VRTIYDSTTVVEIFSGEVIFTPQSTAHYGRILDLLWADAIASLQ
jgi:hypothetical protein